MQHPNPHPNPERRQPGARVRIAHLVGLAGLVLAATLAGLGFAADPIDAPTLTFTITADGIEAPDSVAAGWYRVTAEGDGAASTEVQIGRLAAGTTEAQAAAAFDAMVTAEPGPSAGAAVVRTTELFDAIVGGVGSPPNLVRLEPGEHFAALFGPVDGSPSYASQGFTTTFTVTEATTEAVAPDPDLVVNMMDFAFSIPNEIDAGPQTWEVVNVGEQVHHMILFRVAEGNTVADVMAFMQNEGPPAGPPPFSAAGSVNVLSPDQRNFVAFDFEPGSYVALCFIADYETGVPHVAKGMVSAFTAR